MVISAVATGIRSQVQFPMKVPLHNAEQTVSETAVKYNNLDSQLQGIK